MPRGLRQAALSISFLSPMARRPDVFLATNIASLIFRPDLRFLALTSFQSLNRPNLSSGSSSRISLFKQSVSVSRPRLRPPGNIHSRSRLLLTNKTRPRFEATSFDDFAITVPCYLNTIRQHSLIRSLLQRKLTRNSARFTTSAIEVLHCREMTRMEKLTSVLWHRRATRYPIPSRPFASKQSIEPKGIAHAKNVGRSVVI